MTRENLSNGPNQERIVPKPRIYGTESIHTNADGKECLQIMLDGTGIDLPFEKKGSDASPVYIAWIKPTYMDNPRLFVAASVEMSDLLAEMDCSVVITPQSEKSIGFVRNAVALASERKGKPIETIVLLGGKNFMDRKEGSGIEPVVYRNVTSPDKDKFMGISPEDMEKLRILAPRGKKLVVVDDVWTTGGTIKAAHTTVNIVFGLPKHYTHDTLVLAAESAYGPDYPAKIPPFLQPIICIPEFIGVLPHSV